MHLETLKVFCDVVETGSFSIAASQNFITQSAVSQQLRALEARYQCKLLERSRAGAQPTVQGKILYRAGREIIDRYREMEATLQHSTNVVGGRLRVAIVYSVGLHELPPYLKEYLRSYPEVNVHVEYLRSNRIYDKVISGQIDLGVVAYPRKHAQICIEPIRQDALGLVCPPEHPLAKRATISVAALDRETLVGFERDIATRKATDQFLRNHHVSPRYNGEYDNIETIKRAVEIGQGVAIVPLAATRHEVETGALRVVPFSEQELYRPLGVMHKKGRQLSPAAIRFIDTLKREDLAVDA